MVSAKKSKELQSKNRKTRQTWLKKQIAKKKGVISLSSAVGIALTRERKEEEDKEKKDNHHKREPKRKNNQEKGIKEQNDKVNKTRKNTNQRIRMEELTGFGKKRQLKSHSKEQSKAQ